jgi:hypothetical protein
MTQSDIRQRTRREGEAFINMADAVMFRGNGRAVNLEKLQASTSKHQRNPKSEFEGNSKTEKN